MIRRILVLAALVVLAACGGDDDGGAGSSTPAGGADADTVITIAFEEGEPVEDVWRTDVDLGDRVQVIVEGEVDEQVHVHGYDLYIEPDSADPTIEFDALIPGRFEIELEQSGRLLLEITVS